jgi:hypothetical protein
MFLLNKYTANLLWNILFCAFYFFECILLVCVRAEDVDLSYAAKCPCPSLKETLFKLWDNNII